MARKLLIFTSCIFITISLVIPSAAVGNLYKVAVLPFDDSSIQNRWWGNSWDVGKGVSSVFVTELLNTKKFRVIEREQLDTVTKEQVLGASGPVDSTTAAELGKILGAQYLIIGKVTEFSSDSSSGGFIDPNSMGLAFKTTVARVAVDVRLVDTSTSEIKTSVTGKGEKKNTSLGIATKSTAMAFGSNEFLQTDLGFALRTAANSAANQLAVRAYEGVTVTGIIAYVDESRIIIDLGSEQGIEPGMVFVVYHVVKEIRHPITGALLDEITEAVAEINVRDVKEKSSNCTFLVKGNLTIGDKIKLKTISIVSPSLDPEKTGTEKQSSKRINWK